MGSWFASGRVVDCILAFMIVEIAVLIGIRKTTGRGPRALNLIVSVLAGAALLLALRAALTGQPWTVVAAFLGLGLPAHLWDLARRWSAV